MKRLCWVLTFANQCWLGVHCGQSAFKCTGNKADEKAWSIIDVQLSGRKGGICPSLPIIDFH